MIPHFDLQKCCIISFDVGPSVNEHFEEVKYLNGASDDAFLTRNHIVVRGCFVIFKMTQFIILIETDIYDIYLFLLIFM